MTVTHRNALPFNKQMADYKLRETFGRGFIIWATIRWFVRRAEETEDVRYYRVFNRLMEIEQERSGNA